MMKCFECEFNYNNEPDTSLVFVFAETFEEALAALQAYDNEVTEDDLSEIDPKGEHFRRWARHAEVYHVSRGELTRPGRYDNERDRMIDMQLDRAERL